MSVGKYAKREEECYQNAVQGKKRQRNQSFDDAILSMGSKANLWGTTPLNAAKHHEQQNEVREIRDYIVNNLYIDLYSM